MEELNLRIKALQDEIANIDLQLTYKNNIMKERFRDGIRTDIDIQDFNKWKTAAIKAKVCKLDSLRELKRQRTELFKETNKDPRIEIGDWLLNHWRIGMFCKDEMGYYFSYPNGNVTDYFDTIPELIKHLKETK